MRLFPSLKPSLIAYVLRNSNGDVLAAIDTLHTFVDDNDPKSGGDPRQEKTTPVSKICVHYLLKSACYCKSQKTFGVSVIEMASESLSHRIFLFTIQIFLTL